MRIGHFLITLSLAGAPPLLAAGDTYVREQGAGVLQAPALAEASGLASSPTSADFLWLINDSGSPAELHLADTEGNDRGKIILQGGRNRDWEDLASFIYEGKPYLLIADTGDNASQRTDCMLHVVPEPKLPEKGKSLDGSVKPAWTIRLQYEDGPRDCESVAVDEKAGKILLLSKRTSPPMLYELALRPGSDDVQIAKKTGSIPQALPVGFPPIPYGSQPTGMSIRADGSAAAVVTYAAAFLFPRTNGEDWASAFARPPVNLGAHRMRQAESIAFSRDGGLLRVVSEGGKSPIAVYRRAEKEK